MMDRHLFLKQVHCNLFLDEKVKFQTGYNYMHPIFVVGGRMEVKKFLSCRMSLARSTLFILRLYVLGSLKYFHERMS